MANRKKQEIDVEAADRYEGLRSRSHWKRADAVRVLSDFSRSGLSMTAFSRQHELGLHRLRWWHDRTQDTSVADEQTPVRLVPATLRRAPLVSIESPATQPRVVVSAGAVRVEILEPHDTDPRWVASLVVALRGEVS